MKRLVLALLFSALPIKAEEKIPSGMIELEKFYKNIFEQVAPSVVHISTPKSVGSGFFVDSKGLILTNVHVIGEADEVKVVTLEGRSYTGRVVEKGREDVDVALVQIEARNPTRPLAFANGSSASIGSWTGAIGHALNLGWTFTTGIVSNVHRSNSSYMIQTQTPINPGNSGGPLFNKDGLVVGVNTWKLKESEGLNFAIRIDTAMQYLNGLLPICNCIIIETLEATPVFVDNKMVGTGQRVLIRAVPKTYQIFTVHNGVKIEKKVTYPQTRKVELKP